MESDKPEERQQWSSRYAFWMAAVGSAVGLGNIWRFPWRVYMNGGGAFIIAYFIVLFTIGMPMLTQEMALGQKFQGGDVEAYGRMSPRLRGIGLSSVVGAMLLVSYYSVIIGWSVRYFVASFESPLPWEFDGDYQECYDAVANPDRECDADGSPLGDYEGPCLINECLGRSGAFFVNDVLKASASIEDGDGTFAWEVWGCVIFVWVAVYLSVCKGTKTMSYVVWVTVPLPVLFLIILLIKGLTLDGATQGIEDLWDTDLNLLEDSEIWLQAISQCFFSLSICMGIMTAYSSSTSKGSVATDEKVVAFWDVAIALLSCFVIYSTLGYMNHRAETLAPPRGTMANGEEGPPTWETYSNVGGGSLVFVALPVALASFDGAAFFSAIFFFTLFTLGIDSAFSMIEATSVVITDSDFGRGRLSRPLVAGVLCLFAFGLATLFCFDVGNYHIDVVDHWTITRGMVFIGIMETFALGWVYRIEEQVKAVGRSAVYSWVFGYWFSLFIGVFVALILAKRVEAPDGTTLDYSDWLGADSFWVGLGMVLWGWIVSGAYSICSANGHIERRGDKPKVRRRDIYWGIFGWWGAEDLRTYINSSGGENDWTPTRKNECQTLKPWRCDKLSFAWGWLIKYFIPSLLLVLLMDNLKKDIYQDSYDYPWKYQIEGVVGFCLIVLVTAFVACFPGCMAQSWDKQQQNLGGVQAWQKEADTMELATSTGAAPKGVGESL